MEPFERWEAFHEPSGRVGALRRSLEAGVLTTRIAFGRPPELYLAVSRIRLDDDGSWQLSRFHAPGTTGPVLLDRTGGGFGPESMPGYGEFLLVRRFVAGGAAELPYVQLADDVPGGDPVSAVLRAAPSAPRRTSVAVDGLGLDGARAVERIQAGRTAARHWVRAGEMVASDWQGAVSVPVAGAPSDAAWASLEDLDDAAIEFLTATGRHAGS
ncbi:hypothetical protein ACQ3I4_01830 [Zafaria sp. Z1313]|uniref:hypothetical protein n=1 Tax=Zafaria sp. Z1313 TaxID=3423202 RepID=UPI003D301B9B